MLTMIAFALASTATLSSPPALSPLVTGTVAYRARIALPPNAEVVIHLDRIGAEGPVRISESRMRLDGQQVPVTFAVPYSVGAGRQPGRFFLDARIVAGDRVFAHLAEPVAVIRNGRTHVNLTLTMGDKPASTAAWQGPTWRLAAVDGAEVTLEERPPTVRFNPENGRIEGFGGVNRFGGTFAVEGGKLTLTMGAMTMMAGPPERMELERKLVDALPTVDRASIVNGELRLLQGDKVRLVFRRGG